MAWHLVLVFVHIMVSIVWAGYALFWAIIAGPVGRAYGREEGPKVLALVNRAPWPPRKVPVPFHVKFSGVGWLLLVLLAATGALLVFTRGGSSPSAVLREGVFAGRFGALLGAKLVAVVVLVLMQIRLASRPGRGIALANLAAGAIAVAVSALLARSVGA